jgi:hypothetical protein
MTRLLRDALCGTGSGLPVGAGRRDVVRFFFHASPLRFWWNGHIWNFIVARLNIVALFWRQVGLRLTRRLCRGLGSPWTVQDPMPGSRTLEPAFKLSQFE